MCLIGEPVEGGAVAEALRSLKPEFSEPEPDALKLIQSISRLFSPGADSSELLHYRSMSMSPSETSYELMRAKGAATLENRSPGTLAVLDGLSINLLAGVIGRADRIPKRKSLLKKEASSLSPSAMLSRLNEPSSWTEVWSDSSTEWLEQTFFVELDGKLRKVAFERINAVGRSENPLALLVSSENSARGKTSKIVDLFVDDLNSVLKDQLARNKLALEYDNAPLARALPPELRARIKHELELVGIRNGSYSREGFSSGRFPYAATTAKIQGNLSSLLFWRCRSCGSVSSLSLSEGSRAQIEAALALSKDGIEPWHRSICAAARSSKAEQASEGPGALRLDKFDSSSSSKFEERTLDWIRTMKANEHSSFIGSV